jgi:outer membrane protein
MKARDAVIALAALWMAPAAWAQGQPAGNTARSAADAAPSKVAVLNVQLAIAGTAEGKQAAAELQSQFAPRRNELDNLGKQIEDVQSRLRNGDRTLSDEEKARLARQSDQMTRQYQRKQQEVQDDANDARNEVLDRIGSKLMEVLNRYARENGYSVVLDTSSQSPVVLFASNQVDITQDIIRLYDQTNPVKTTAAPAAQPRPVRPAPAPAPAKPQP